MKRFRCMFVLAGMVATFVMSSGVAQAALLGNNWP